MSDKNRLFIEKANEKHNSIYIYDRIVYVNSKTPIEIGCQKHGYFFQRPNDHLNGSGCPDCKKTKLSKLKNFGFDFDRAGKIHNFKYVYSDVVYVNCDVPVDIICPMHGKFSQSPYKHYKGSGCPVCWKEKLAELNRDRNKKSILTQEEFIDRCVEAHGNLYNYSKSVYVGMRVPLIIVCDKHGDFSQAPHNHIYNRTGCPSCTNKQEEDLRSMLLSFGVGVRKDRTVLDGLEIDCYVEEKNIGFEFNGLYWHSEEHKEKYYHRNKTNTAESKGIHLIHIYEDVMRDKRGIIESRIKNVLGIIDRKIYARKCEVRIVKDYKHFLEDNHLQGYVGANVAIGLYIENELVSIMTFGKLRRNLGFVASEKDTWELLRFCNKIDTVVVGAATKLFSWFVNNYDPNVVISYADRSWSINNKSNVYSVMGFEYVGVTRPNYHYIVDGIRENRYKYRKDVLVAEGFDSSKSEAVIMRDRKIWRIYDSGNLKYVWKKNHKYLEPYERKL